jgi:hypothetical protein
MSDKYSEDDRDLDEWECDKVEALAKRVKALERRVKSLEKVRAQRGGIEREFEVSDDSQDNLGHV